MTASFSVEDTGRRSARVVVEGDVDIATSHDLRDEIHRVVDSGRVELVIDLQGVDFIDSTGLGVLVGALRRVKAAHGTLTLVVTDGPVRSVFDITGLALVFNLVSGTGSATPAPDGNRA